MSILDKNYAERRILVVASRLEQQRPRVDAKRVAWVVAEAMADAVPLPGTRTALRLYREFAGPTPSPESDLQPPPGVLLLDDEATLQAIRFPPGHPVPGHAYAGHPLIPTRYVPVEVFHHFMFEEKVNELVTLLASLGASRVRVSARRGYKKAGSIGLDIKSPQGSGAVGASAKESRESAAVFEEHFRSTGTPKLPEGLVWYGHEASWQQLAQRRLNYGTASFKAELRYEDSFGVDAQLKVGLESIGVKLGGEFTEFEQTTWQFEGEFA